MAKLHPEEFEFIRHPLIPHMTLSILGMVFRGEHMHTDIEILQVLEGSLHVRTRQEEYDMESGDVALFNANEVHSFRSNQLTPCTLLLLQLDPAFCSSHYPQIYNLHFLHSNLRKVLPEHILADVQNSCFHVGYHYFGQLPGFSFRCLSDLNRLMGLMVVFIPHKILSDDDYLAQMESDARISRILQYIHQHYKEKITLNEIARQEHLSFSYLSHMLKDALNQPFQKYVNRLRFEHALFLLQNTNMKIIHICNESGFSDSKYLNRMFLEIFGLTPKAYRYEYMKSCQKQKQNTLPNNQTGQNHVITYSLQESISILRANHKFHCDEDDKFDTIRITP